MPALTAPTNVAATVSGDNVTVNWTKVAGAASYVAQLVSIGDGTVYDVTPVADPEAETVTVPATAFKAADPSWASHYFAQVQAVGATPADSSPFAGSFFWDVVPSLTFQIGSHTLTLEQIRALGGVYTFKLPVDPANPIIVTPSEFTTFLSTLASALSLPSLPGLPADIGGLQINAFMVSTDGNFDMDVAYLFGSDFNGWQVFPGFTVHSVGLAVRHSNQVPS